MEDLVLDKGKLVVVIKFDLFFLVLNYLKRGKVFFVFIFIIEEEVVIIFFELNKEKFGKLVFRVLNIFI